MRGHQLIVAVVGIGASAYFVLASGLAQSPPAGKCLAAANGASDITDSAPDLQVELPINAANRESVQYRAAVPGFELVRAKLKPDRNTTRARVGIRFVSRTAQSARIGVELLDSMKERHVLHQAFREEQLGPERVVIKGTTIPLVSNWDDYRALWFDFPSDARECRAIRVTVHLQRLGNAQSNSTSTQKTESQFSDVFITTDPDFAPGANVCVVLDTTAGDGRAMDRAVARHAAAALQAAQQIKGEFQYVVFFMRRTPESKYGNVAAFTVAQLQDIIKLSDSGKVFKSRQSWVSRALPARQ